jgi:hypothetical protein
MSIYYFCHSPRHQFGGIKQTYRHVEALCDAGVEAYVLTSIDESADWFESKAPIAVLPGSLLRTLGGKLPQTANPLLRRLAARMTRAHNPLDWLAESAQPTVRIGAAGTARSPRQLTADDFLVLPEIYGKLLMPSAFGAKVVIFNQNAHYTFNGVGYADELDGFLHRGGAVAALAVSSHNADYLRFAFPNLNVLLTPNGVDVKTFYDCIDKKRQIAFMPRKLPRDLVQVIQILRGRGALRGWELCPIDRVPEPEVARLLRESAFFLSSCEAEGFGLPPLEAAACGCIVVGYHGQAAREFMLPEYCFPVDQGDVLGFARTTERLLKEYEQDPSALARRSNAYAEFVKKKYSRETEAKGVVEAWQKIFTLSGGSCPHF